MDTQKPPYHFQAHPDHCELTLHPGMNDVAWTNIDQAGQEIVNHLQGLTEPRVLVDLSPLDYIGSALVALVVRVYKTIEKQDGRMAVINHEPMVLEVLKIARLTSVWSIFEDRSEAMKFLGARDPKAGKSSGTGLRVLLLILSVVALGAALASSYAIVRSVPLAGLEKEALLAILCGGGIAGVVLGGILMMIRGPIGQKINGFLVSIGSLVAVLVGLLLRPA